MTAPAERCDRCDRIDCPLPAARAAMRDTLGAPASVQFSAAREVQNAQMHCDMHPVNWVRRCRAAEALLREADGMVDWSEVDGAADLARRIGEHFRGGQ